MTFDSTKFKIVFLGNQGVGKSALASRFVYDVFENNYQPTIGIDFMTTTLQIGEYSKRLCLAVFTVILVYDKNVNKLNHVLRTGAISCKLLTDETS